MPAQKGQAGRRRRVQRALLALLAAASLTASQPVCAQSTAAGESWWGPDKALHLTAGFGLSAGGYVVGRLAFDDRLAATGFGAGLAIGLAAGKEGLDAAGLGTPSWQDFVWSVVGTALGLGASITFDAALTGPE
jgi:uncharacterized protein YfiM (DUF2279 family)